MNKSINKNVVCIKDIPSNLIEEAIFILKADVDNKKFNSIRNEIILRETEDLVKEYENELDDFEIIENENKINNVNDIKLKIILLSVLFVGICLLISMLI